MDRFILSWIRVCVLFLCFVSASAVWGEDSKASLSTRTHLNGTSRQIVMLSTTCIPSDNIPRAFLYDRNELASPFTVPKGFSFVITDIIVVPDVDPNPTDRFLAVVTIGVIRTFTAGFIGAVTQHYSLTGGLVVPEEVPLNARNVLPTSTCINVQLLGYFVRGPGLDVGNPFPFQELAQ